MSAEAVTMKRLFVGSYLAEDQMAQLQSLQEQSTRLSEYWHRGLRFVRPEKLHMTWLFLGNVAESAIPELRDRLSGLLDEVHPMSITYTQPAIWPKPSSARQLVLVSDSVPPEISQLGQILRNELRDWTEKEEKDFCPHITLLRFNPGNRDAIQVPPWFPLNSILPLPQKLDKICLIESHLGPGGAYSALQTYRLAAHANR